MELNDIKKILYKEKHYANFLSANNESLLYGTFFSHDEKRVTIYFSIPFSEIGDACFYDKMPARHLIRWLVIK